MRKSARERIPRENDSRSLSVSHFGCIPIPSLFRASSFRKSTRSPTLQDEPVWENKMTFLVWSAPISESPFRPRSAILKLSSPTSCRLWANPWTFLRALLKSWAFSRTTFLDWINRRIVPMVSCSKASKRKLGIYGIDARSIDTRCFHSFAMDRRFGLPLSRIPWYFFFSKFY